MSTDFPHLLKEKKLKVTPARVAILKAFKKECSPLNADALFEKVKGSNINLVTVYRTLAVFEKYKLIKRIDLHKDSVHYELADGTHHHHMVCTGCGYMEDFETCVVEDFAKEILKDSQRFKRIEEHSLELFGLCATCVKK